MRHLLVVGILLLSGCSDGTPEISQHSSGDFAPNQVAGRDAIQNVQVQLSAAAEERLVQSLIDKGVPVAERAAELEELKRKYADLEQRLGEYAKTDELAQQARQALEQGNLDQAEALLQQAYDKDSELSRQRLAQRAFDLAEVAELKLEHDKALARYREVTQLQPDHISAWWEIAKITRKLGSTRQALEAWRGMQQAAQTQQQERELAAAILGEADILKANGDGKAAQEKYAAAHATLLKAAKAAPDDTGKQRDLSVSYERIGDLYRANGDTSAALKAYQDGLTIRDKLVKLDPNIVEWQSDVAVSNYKLMLFYKDEGNKKKAIQHGETALNILKELQQTNKLDADQKGWIGITESELQELRQLGGGVSSAPPTPLPATRADKSAVPSTSTPPTPG